jgi:hypothetical protein
MEKQITMVYEDHGEQQSLHYSGPEGIVWMSNKANPLMPNVFINCNSFPDSGPGPKDCILINEPITVAPAQYNVDYLNRFYKIFACFEKVFQNTKINNKFISINCGCDLNDYQPENFKNNWLPWEKKKNGIIIVSSGKTSSHHSSVYHLRFDIAELFHKNGFEVAWYGGMPRKYKPSYFKGYIPDKCGELIKYRFNICPENTYDPIYSYNYLTEKLPHSIISGTVPLYLGCYNIDQLAPKNSFFDLRNYIDERKQLKTKDLLSAIKAYNKNDFENYQKAAFEWLKDPKGILYHIDMRQYYKKMLISIFEG